jgi:protein O-GlcNAc transferase
MRYCLPAGLAARPAREAPADYCATAIDFPRSETQFIDADAGRRDIRWREAPKPGGSGAVVPRSLLHNGGSVAIMPPSPPHISSLPQLRQRASAAYRSGDLAAAQGFAMRILQQRCDDFEALTMLGIIAAQTGRGEEALARLARAAQVRPGDPGAYNNLGNVLGQLGRAQPALQAYDRAIALNAEFADAHNNRGSVLLSLGRNEEALSSYDRAVAIRSSFGAAWNNRGNVLRELRRYDEALTSHERALAIQPNFAEASIGLGATLAAMSRPAEALVCFDRALAVSPDHVVALMHRAAALNDLRRSAEALANIERAISIAPGLADAHNNRGNALRELRRPDEALASHDRAIALRPDFAEAHNSRGVALSELHRPADALASFARAIELQPDFADAVNNRGYALRDLKRLPEAVADFERALALKPQLPGLLGSFAQARMQMCDWNGIEPLIERMESEVLAGAPVAFPFNVLALSGSASAQRRAAETYVRTKWPPNDTLGSPQPHDHGRIRIGYFSADFHDHATTYLMAELLETHDRQRFEVFCFSFGPDAQDEMRRRVVAACDRFIDVRSQSDEDVARLARTLEIDIAVDLKGFTQDCRAGIFAYRAAPIQAGYLGYPGTMGAPYIDYLIADEVLIPADSRSHFVEKIVYLPDSYQVNDRRRRVADRTPSRAECGLPDGFVFCCFNNSYKISPHVFDRWMRILAQVGGAVLWLLEDNPAVTANLRREASARNIDPDRLVFAPRLNLPEHLARHRLADLFLDTLPCNAHTTASDALWVGVPVLTFTGEAFAGRVAASLLQAVGLTELIVRDADRYESLAVELAHDPQHLGQIRRQLRGVRDNAPLFDTPRFTRHLEQAYSQMVDRCRSGLAPDHLSIPRLPAWLARDTLHR